MNKLLILQGIPASGKSTFARQWVEENPVTRVIVNRDSIRRGLGVYWVPSRESLVSSIEEHSVWEALEMGYNVCLDATNLNPNFLKKWEELADLLMIPIEFKKFDISLEEALKRDKEREFPVGDKVIIDFYNKYEKTED